MSAAAKGPSRIAPASPALLSAPLDFFFAEHFRQRQLYALLDQLAAAETLDPTLVEPVLDYLRHDMPLHVCDEEEGLFPLMRRRCRPEDEIESVLTKLSTEHAAHRSLARRVIRGLERALAEGQGLDAYRGLRKALRDYARGDRRHLALENAVVLPLARLRLKARDLAELSAGMTARHAAREAPKDQAEQGNEGDRAGTQAAPDP